MRETRCVQAQGRLDSTYTAPPPVVSSVPAPAAAVAVVAAAALTVE
jgi:hypothetical protein